MGERTILYGGYGANRSDEMLRSITGNQLLTGKPAIFQDVELCIQRFDQIPDTISSVAPVPKSPKSIMIESWGKSSSFETYTIRHMAGGRVAGAVFELSKVERALIAEWEMIEFGWYKRMQLIAVLEDGTKVTVENEGLGDNQDIDRAVDGLDYPTYLNDPTEMFKVADKAREDYLLRQ